MKQFKVFLLCILLLFQNACSFKRSDLKPDTEIRIERKILSHKYFDKKSGKEYGAKYVYFDLNLHEKPELAQDLKLKLRWSQASLLASLIGISTLVLHFSKFKASKRADHNSVRNTGLLLSGLGFYIFPMFSRNYFSSAVEKHNQLLPKRKPEITFINYRYSF